MREREENVPAPQAPTRRPSTHQLKSCHLSLLDTFNSHRISARPKLKKLYRPTSKPTLSRIDEAPTTSRPRSKSLQQSTDFSSTKPMLRSRSNISADTGRSVPVCNQSYDVQNKYESASPQYAEPKTESSCDGRASMSDLVPMEPLKGSYYQYPEYTYYQVGNTRWNNRWKSKKRKVSKPNNLYLAFMY